MLLETHAELQSYAGLNTAAFAWGAVVLTLIGFVGALLAAGWSGGSLAAFVLSLLVIRYGLSMLKTAEKFTLECLFSSKIAVFSVEGTWGRTYTEKSKLKGGK